MSATESLRRRDSRLSPAGVPTPAVDSPLEPLTRGREAALPLAFREQFCRTPDESFRVVLVGLMHEIRYPRILTPLFRVLGRLRILVPRAGHDVPTRLVVRPGRTRSGMPYHVWDRTFEFDVPIRFPTTIIYDPEIDHLVDLVGPRNLLYMVWEARLAPPGTFTLASAAIALRIGGRRVWLPDWLWPLMLGRVSFAQVARLPDDDTIDIDLRLSHPLFGEVFGYRGSFHAERHPTDAIA